MQEEEVLAVPELTCAHPAFVVPTGATRICSLNAPSQILSFGKERIREQDLLSTLAECAHVHTQHT